MFSSSFSRLPKSQKVLHASSKYSETGGCELASDTQESVSPQRPHKDGHLFCEPGQVMARENDEDQRAAERVVDENIAKIV